MAPSIAAVIFAVVMWLILAGNGKVMLSRRVKTLIGSVLGLVVACGVWIDYTGFREAVRRQQLNNDKIKLENDFLEAVGKIESLSDGKYSIPTSGGDLQIIVSMAQNEVTSESAESLAWDYTAWAYRSLDDAESTGAPANTRNAVDGVINNFYDSTNGTFSPGVSAINMAHYVNTTLPAWRRVD